MAYVLLPPAGGLLLLITEHKSDYVRLVTFPWGVAGRGEVNSKGRFHAWQSSLLFAFMVVSLHLHLVGGERKLICGQQVMHLVFSFSAFLSYTLLVVDILMILYLSMRAYQDADTLDRWVLQGAVEFWEYELTWWYYRWEVPFFGPLASSILDDE